MMEGATSASIAISSSCPPLREEDPASSVGILWRLLLFFVRYRCLFGLLVISFLLCSTLLSLSVFRLPDMRDPSVDFVTINTEWSAKVQQYRAMMIETNELPFRSSLGFATGLSVADESSGLRRNVRSVPAHFSVRDSNPDLCFDESAPTVNLWKLYSSFGRVVVSLDSSTSHTPDSVKTDLFTEPHAFLSLCTLQQRIANLDAYRQECLYSSRASDPAHRCCPMWSLPTMLRALVHADSCEAVVPHLQQLRTLLISCLPAFRNGTLRRSCWDTAGSDPTLLCPRVEPVDCLRSPFIPLILATTLPDTIEQQPHGWRITLLVLPLRRANSLAMYKQLDAAYRSGKLTAGLDVPLHLQGMYLHAYNELVSEFLARDAFRLGVALAVLLVLLGLGTCSVWFPLLALLGICWSLLTAYALYTHVLRIENFPVINFMAIVLVIGLGTDDLLVYFQVWNSGEKKSRFGRTSSPENLDQSVATRERTDSCETTLVSKLHFAVAHAIPSMGMTTLSTILGLGVNFFSSIVAVQRFSLFTILAVSCNFLYVLCVAPIAFVFQYVLNAKVTRRLNCPRSLFSLNWSPRFSSLLVRSRFFLMFLFVVLLCLSLADIFVQKRFTPPPSQSMNSASSFFAKSHPFELFLSEQADLFWAERTLHYHSHLLQIHFVWGIHPTDSRSLWSYKHDADAPRWLPAHHVNLTSRSSRQWLFAFCDTHLRQMPYAQLEPIMDSRHFTTLPSFSIAELNPYLRFPVWCPLGHFPNSMDNYVFLQACHNHTAGHCCPRGHPVSVLSLSAREFSRCLAEYLLVEGPHLPRAHLSGYRFVPDNDQVTPAAFVVTVLTNISMTNTTPSMLDRIASDVDEWYRRLATTAPDSLKFGNVVIPSLGSSQVASNITNYIHWSILCAVLMATLLVLLSCRSLCLSVAALCALLGCLLFTVSVLALCDSWELGLVEGLVISLAAGLAIDPCLHLSFSLVHTARRSSVTPRLCPYQTPPTLGSIEQSLNLLNSAVTGSSWSTAIAGFCMIGCNLLCYHQIGVFLVTLMFSSWLFCYVLFAGNVACISSLISRACSRQR